MAVKKIKVISIIGRIDDLDKVTVLCGKSRVFHPDNALSFYSDTSEFSPLNQENPYLEPLSELKNALSFTNKKLKLLSSKDVAKINIKTDNLESYIEYISNSFKQIHKEYEITQKKITKYNIEIKRISHFVGLDLNLNDIHSCRYIKFRFGSLPKESFEKLKSYNQNPYVVFFPCTSDQYHYWGVYFTPIEMASEVDRIFSSLYFERTRLSDLTESPEKGVKTLREKRDQENIKIKKLEEQFNKLWEQEKSMCQKVYSWLTEQSVYFGIRSYAAKYNDNFILTGWIPEDKEKYFANKLDKIESVNCTFESADEQLTHSPPVKLENKKPFKPFEFFVDMYGLPSYDEVDPTPFVAITYFLLFGIMFGDLGQGLCVSIIGYFMWKIKKMELGKILIPCGISSAVFGIVFGSVFGFEHIVDPLYKIIGFSKKPVEVMKPSTTNMIIYSAVGIGISLVIIAILINIYSSIKRKNYENAFFGPNGIAGLIFYSALVAGFGGQLAFGWHIVNSTYILCFIILPIVIMFFREILGGLVERKPNWKPEKWGDYIMQNFFEVFEFLLSYATNTMSFLRVGAFVLVHAGMMLVVFTLAEMSGPIGSAIVIIVGNIFVMALEGLLVGIQVLRLEFYEMFSRFFDGGGRPYSPVIVHNEQ